MTSLIVKTATNSSDSAKYELPEPTWHRHRITHTTPWNNTRGMHRVRVLRQLAAWTNTCKCSSKVAVLIRSKVYSSSLLKEQTKGCLRMASMSNWSNDNKTEEVAKKNENESQGDEPTEEKNLLEKQIGILQKEVMALRRELKFTDARMLMEKIETKMRVSLQIKTRRYNAVAEDRNEELGNSEAKNPSKAEKKYEGYLLTDKIPPCKSPGFPNESDIMNLIIDLSNNSRDVASSSNVFANLDSRDHSYIKNLDFDLLNISPSVANNLNDVDNLDNCAGSKFNGSIRFVKSLSWDRLEMLRKFIPNIPFQMVLEEADKSRPYPHEFIHKFCQLAGECGMNIFRVFDSRNSLPNLLLGLEAAGNTGGIVEAAISYMGDVSDPSQTEYDLNYYLNLADELIKAGAQFLVIKDMAGLLKPSAATLLVSTLRKRHPSITISIQKHDAAADAIVPAMLVCASVNDVAIDDITSQPNTGALVARFEDYGRYLDLDSMDGWWSVYSACWQRSTISIKSDQLRALETLRLEKNMLELELKILKCRRSAERCLDYRRVADILMEHKIEIEARVPLIRNELRVKIDSNVDFRRLLEPGNNYIKDFINSTIRNELWVKYIDEDEDWRSLLVTILTANNYTKDFSSAKAIASNIDDIHKFLGKLLELGLILA